MPAVELSEVSLEYRVAHNRSRSLKEAAANLVRGRMALEDKVALHGVDLVVDRGEFLGIIGPNGAGKSTLMKLVARVLPPTNGRVVVRGSVAAMIELAAGLDLELTAAENVLLYGAMLGRSRRYMQQRLDAILEQAGVAEQADVPVRAFSSGMLARLGFAVCTDVDPDVLLIDEVFAVGDEAFQRRSIGRINELVSKGTTILFVSHDLDLVASVASRVIWLDGGEVRMSDAPDVVVRSYRRSASGQG